MNRRVSLFILSKTPKLKCVFLRQGIGLIILAGSLSGCGGGAADQEKGLLGQSSNPTPEPTATAEPTPSPGPNLTPTVTPEPTVTPNPTAAPTPEPTSRPDPEQPSDLVKPVVSASVDGSVLNLSWDAEGASSYRVIYWLENRVEPSEFETASSAFSSPPLTAGSYTVLIEAYDALGNSLFSDPTEIGVGL